MNAWRRCSRVLHTVCMGVLSRPLRLGIVPRLVIAFIAVGALLLAAVFVAERSVSTERTIRITRTVTVPPPPLKPIEGVSPESIDSMTSKAATERRAITSDALMLAAHARALIHRWWRCEVTIALPRLRPALLGRRRRTGGHEQAGPGHAALLGLPIHHRQPEPRGAAHRRAARD